MNNDGEFAYITNQTNGAISQCPIDLSTGSFGACSYGGDVANPLAIALNEEDGLAYVSGVDNLIYLCPIETWDQSISSCTDSGVTGVSSSYSIAISQ